MIGYTTKTLALTRHGVVPQVFCPSDGYIHGETRETEVPTLSNFRQTHVDARLVSKLGIRNSPRPSSLSV